MHLNTAYFIVGVAARRTGIVVAKDCLALIRIKSPDPKFIFDGESKLRINRPDPRQLSLIKFRTGKALAGAGHLTEANNRYASLANRQDGLKRAETIREQCNVVLQQAWTWPKKIGYQQKLYNLLLEAKKSLGNRAPKGDATAFAKVETSLREFSGNLGLLRKPPHEWKKKELSNIKTAIKELMAVEPTTGRNRHAHLATLYLRRFDPDFALECVSSVREKIESNMEKALSWLVEGQAIRLQEMQLASERQLVAFKTAEDLVKTIPGDRYRRVVHAFRIQADANASRLEKIGTWTSNILWGNRAVGSFVPKLPTVNLKAT